jgi:5-methylcytosine-specific restriction protein A
VALLPEIVDEFGADQTGAADDDDFHIFPFSFRGCRRAATKINKVVVGQRTRFRPFEFMALRAVRNSIGFVRACFPCGRQPVLSGRRLLEFNWRVWEAQKTISSTTILTEELQMNGVELVQRFNEEMLDIYHKLATTTDYRPSYFLKKVRRVGGLKAAKDWLIEGQSPTRGFDRLKKLGRLDCAVEVLVLREPWAQLFTASEKIVARERLASAGCNIDEILAADAALPQHESVLADYWEINAAGKMFERLLVDAESRKTCLDFLGNSIEQSHSLSPICWALTLGRDYVRLNVGSIEAFTVHPQSLNVIVHRDVPTPDHPKLKRSPKARTLYKSVAGSTAHELPARHATILLPITKKSHEYLIEKAVAKSTKTKWHYAHKPALVIYLSHFLNRELPQPAYLKEAGQWNERRRRIILPEELPAGSCYQEGAVRKIWISAFERDAAAREACIKAHGRRCAVCGMSFEEEYGAKAADIIHVHHLKPLAQSTGPREVNPVEDLLPLCPNCHAVVHQAESEMLSIDEVRRMREEAADRKRILVQSVAHT